MAMEIEEKVGLEICSMRRAQILKLLTSEEYNPKSSNASAFEAKLLNPSTQWCLHSIHPVTQDIQPAVLQFVLYSSLTKVDELATIRAELCNCNITVDPSEKIMQLKLKLKEDEKKKYDQFQRKKVEEYGTNAGDQNVDEMLKNAVKEKGVDFNSAWDIDVNKMYLPIDLRDPMNEE